MNKLQPRAWMRRWAHDYEVPVKVRNPETGRMALPFKFKLHEVTPKKCLHGDVPLYSAPEVLQLVKKLVSVAAEDKHCRHGGPTWTAIMALRDAVEAPGE